MARRVYEVYLRWWRGPVQLVDGRLVQDVAQVAEYELGATIAKSEAAFDLASVQDARSAITFTQQLGLLAGTPDAPAAEQPLADVLLAAELVREPLLRIIRQRQQGGAPDPERKQALDRLAAKANADNPSAAQVEFYENLFEEEDGVRHVLGLRAQSLLAAIYLQVRALLLNDQPVGQCLNCGRFFSHDDPRQRYCSRTCLATAASRRHRQRKRGAEPAAAADVANATLPKGKRHVAQSALRT
jgi:hypothetical protein